MAAPTQPHTISINLRAKRATSTKISLSDKSAPDISTDSLARVCLVCTNKVADYCCPRCFKPYCSSECYKKHDSLCTEEFNKSNVQKILELEKLENEKIGEDSIHAYSDTGAGSDGRSCDTASAVGIEFDEELLESITQKLHDNASSTHALTPEEKRYLDRVVRSVHGTSGSAMVKLWTPYWQPLTDPLLQDSSPSTANCHKQKTERKPGSVTFRASRAYGRVDVVRMHSLDAQLAALQCGLLETRDRRTSTSPANTYQDSTPPHLQMQQCHISAVKDSGNRTGKRDGSGGDVLLGYQALGALLGYVTMMRTLSGGWAPHLVEDSAVENQFTHDTTGDDGDGSRTASSSVSGASSPEKDSNWQEEVRQCLAHLHLDGMGSEDTSSMLDDVGGLNCATPDTCLELLLHSTPFLSPSFRPVSVADAVAAWVSAAPPSLMRGAAKARPIATADATSCNELNGSRCGSDRYGGGGLRNTVRALLVDVCHILTSPHIALYALLDMWLLGLVSEPGGGDPTNGEGREESHAIAGQSLQDRLISVACWPPDPDHSLCETVLPLASQYRDNVFTKRSKDKKRNISPAELYTRKTFLLFTHFLSVHTSSQVGMSGGSGESHSGHEYLCTDIDSVMGDVQRQQPWNEILWTELNWYIHECC